MAEVERVQDLLYPYQKTWCQDRSPLKIWLAARQIGKSFALAFEALTLALFEKCQVLMVSTSERQSRENMEKVYSLLRILKIATADLLQAERETRTEVKLPPYSSRILSLPANPTTVRGFSGHVFLDEFAHHRDSRAIWRALYPTVTRGFSIRIAATANGKQNAFYDLWAHNERFSKHKTTIYDAVEQGLDVDVEELRSGLDYADDWAQEYEVQFVDGASALLTYDTISECELERVDAGLEDVEGDLYVGVDIGRRRDLTVFWCIEKLGDVYYTRKIEEMERSPFSVQREQLCDILKHPNLRRCCIDETGLGMQLAEEAQQQFGKYRIEPVTFTPRAKEELAVGLLRKFEDHQIRIPPDPRVRDDLHAVRKVITAAGNIRYDAERTEDGHADRFWAAALAVHAGGVPASEIAYTGFPRKSAGLKGVF